MSTFLLLTVTGLGLGALYFLIASGLSLIYGLMGVLNFAHGAFLTVGAYATWFTESKLGGLAVLPRFLLGALVGLVVGGVAAAVAGVLSNVYFGTIDPQRGTSLLIFAFIVVVIGGLGSLRGTAVAAVVVGLVQQYANYYASSGLGDLSVVLLLGLVLLVRPRGLSGSFA